MEPGAVRIFQPAKGGFHSGDEPLPQPTKNPLQESTDPSV